MLAVEMSKKKSQTVEIHGLQFEPYCVGFPGVEPTPPGYPMTSVFIFASAAAKSVATHPINMNGILQEHRQISFKCGTNIRLDSIMNCKLCWSRSVRLIKRKFES